MNDRYYELIINFFNNYLDFNNPDTVAFIKGFDLSLSFTDKEKDFLKSIIKNFNIPSGNLNLYELLDGMSSIVDIEDMYINIETVDETLKKIKFILRLVKLFRDKKIGIQNPEIESITKYNELLREYKDFLRLEPENIVQNSILINAEKRFDILDNDYKIKLVKYFLSHQIPYNKFKQKMIQNNITHMKIQTKIRNYNITERKRIYERINSLKNKINNKDTSNINNMTKRLNNSNTSKNVKLYQFYLKIIRLIQNTDTCEKIIILFKKINIYSIFTY